LIRAASARAIAAVAAGVHEVAPAAEGIVAPTAPIVGAALLGVDAIGSDTDAVARARAQLDAAFAVIEGDGSRFLTDGVGVGVGSSARESMLRGRDHG